MTHSIPSGAGCEHAADDTGKGILFPREFLKKREAVAPALRHPPGKSFNGQAPAWPFAFAGLSLAFLVAVSLIVQFLTLLRILTFS